jgi:hypothetical protein
MVRSAPRIIYRNRKVCDKIKNRYLPNIPHAEMPNQKRVTESANFEKVPSMATGILNCGMDLLRRSAIISKSSKSDGFADLYCMAVGSGYQSENRRKIWINLLIGNSPGKRDKGKSK